MKYIFEVIYELGSLAVVNVRDIGGSKHAFKLLIFPDTRVFQCTSGTAKVKLLNVLILRPSSRIVVMILQKEWLDKFDQAKKARLTQEQQKRGDSIVEKSPSRAVSIDSPSIGNNRKLFISHDKVQEIITTNYLNQHSMRLRRKVAQFIRNGFWKSPKNWMFVWHNVISRML